MMPIHVELVQYLQGFSVPDAQPADDVVLQTAGDAIKAIELRIRRPVADAFEGHDETLQVIVALLVNVALFPTRCKRDVRLEAATAMMRPFQAEGH